MNDTARKWIPMLILHALAVIAAATAEATDYFWTLSMRDARVFAFGRTFIFHQGGRVVVRTPANQLFECNLFTHVEPVLILLACAAYLAAWLLVICLAICLPPLRNRRARAPRGFPLD